MKAIFITFIISLLPPVVAEKTTEELLLGDWVLVTKREKGTLITSRVTYKEDYSYSRHTAFYFGSKLREEYTAEGRWRLENDSLSSTVNLPSKFPRYLDGFEYKEQIVSISEGQMLLYSITEDTYFTFNKETLKPNKTVLTIQEAARPES